MLQIAVGLYKRFRNKTISRGGRACSFLQGAKIWSYATGCTCTPLYDSPE